MTDTDSTGSEGIAAADNSRQADYETRLTHRWHTDSCKCSHSNDDVCPFCDFDGYYAATYPDCPWREAD